MSTGGIPPLNNQPKSKLTKEVKKDPTPKEESSEEIEIIQAKPKIAKPPPKILTVKTRKAVTDTLSNYLRVELSVQTSSTRIKRKGTQKISTKELFSKILSKFRSKASQNRDKLDGVFTKMYQSIDKWFLKDRVPQTLDQLNNTFGTLVLKIKTTVPKGKRKTLNYSKNTFLNFVMTQSSIGLKPLTPSINGKKIVLRIPVKKEIFLS